MSAAQHTALIQHALDLGYEFRQNMALKHGLPEPSRTILPPSEPPPPAQPVVVRLETTQPLATATATAQPQPVTQTPMPSAPVAENTGELAAAPAPINWAKRAALLAALAAGSGGAGYALSQFAQGDSGPTVNVQAADQSLLNWLQERGYHLPPGNRTSREPTP